MAKSMLEFAASMKKHFGITRANTFLDPQMSAIKGHPCLDILLLDDWLHEKHGEYEDDGLSMSDLVEREYGPKANNWILTEINYE